MNWAEIKSDFPYPEIDENLHSYIVERDNGLCQWCGGQGHHLHHIRFKSHQGTNAPNNLILVCIKCHRALHAYELKGNGKLPTSDRMLRLVKCNDRKLRRRLVV